MTTAPMIKVCGLWEKTSARGSRYLIGRIAGAKVLILENQDREGEDAPSHQLFFVDGAKPVEATHKGGASVQRRQRQAPRFHPPVRPDSVPMVADSVDDLYRDAPS